MRRADRLLFLLALGAFAAGLAWPASGAGQGHRPPLHTPLHSVEIGQATLHLRRIEVRCAEDVAPTCGLSSGNDLGILHYVVRNPARVEFVGRVDLFTLLGAPAPPSREPSGFWGSIHPDASACGVTGLRAYDIDDGLRLAPRARARLHALFEIPRGAHPVRVLLHDDDFPTCLSAPRVTYSGRACRPRTRRPNREVNCAFFDR